MGTGVRTVLEVIWLVLATASACRMPVYWARLRPRRSNSVFASSDPRADRRSGIVLRRSDCSNLVAAEAELVGRVRVIKLPLDAAVAQHHPRRGVGIPEVGGGSRF